MDTEQKIRFLMSQALQDQEGNGSLKQLSQGWRTRAPLDPINIRSLPDRGFGRSRIFRILLTNACSFHCAYCPMRAGRDLPRHALEPATLAEAFLTAYRRGWVAGLFLTSGIPKNPRWTTDRMIELVEILRLRRSYAGYLHVKVVSGAEPAQVERLALLCDRVSYNLEAVCQATLDRASTGKSLGEGRAMLASLKQTAARAGCRRLAGDPRPPGPAVAAGATTQIVVGLGSETDRQLLGVTASLWSERTIHHPHFAAFRPIEDTPMENAEETPVLRENRLYQADYLIRQYGFSLEELVFRDSGNLPLGRDPKLAWALAHPESFPVEITSADRRTLLRVPGLGPKAVNRLLLLRGTATAVGLADLSRIGAVASRAVGFLAWRGKRLGARTIQELLWAPEDVPEKPRVYSFSPGTFR